MCEALPPPTADSASVVKGRVVEERERVLEDF